MRNRFFLFFFAAILLLLFLPQGPMGAVRTYLITKVCPRNSTSQNRDEVSHLAIENQLLRKEIERLKSWARNELQMEKETRLLFALAHREDESFFRRRQDHLEHILRQQFQALPAQIVFSDPCGWSHLVWINVGEKDNRALGTQIIAKNSPVLVGKAVIGVVEKVKESHSQVRLITDRALTISVRAVRGGEQDRVLLEKVGQLAHLMQLHGYSEAVEYLETFKEQMPLHATYQYLAKGELHGKGTPLAGGNKRSLLGEGFSYDFADEEGHSPPKGSLVALGDLLVTTGMDGVFPADLHVATVEKIYPQRSGESSLHIDAAPCTQVLFPLTEVFVLPPQFDFDKNLSP